MPFTSIPPSWIQAGKPTKEELFQLISDNMEQFNTDIAALQQTSVVSIFDVKISGFPQNYTSSDVTERLPVFKAPITGSITSVVISLLSTSSSGSASMDIQKSTNNGASWSSILSTPVVLSGTTVGSVSGAVNFVSLAAQQFNQNDMLRITFSSFQVDQGNLHVSIYGEVA
jgi:FlaG/FlaF family flagellin (archaellin)